MKKFVYIAVALIIVLVIVVLAQSPGSSDGVAELDEAPDFSLTDSTGSTFGLSDFSGKVLVLNSWATWCPFCVNELDDFAQLQKEFDGRVQVVAINRQESAEKSGDFIRELGLEGGMLYLLDLDDSFYRSIGGFSMPETIFVNASGEIVFHKRGPMEIEEMRERVNDIINTF